MAPTVLLLHGQPGGGADWQRVEAALAGRASVLAPDRPGWDGRTQATGLAGNAAALLARLDELGLEQVTLGGHSYGAAIACWVAATAPERVSALMLAAPSANLASLYAFDRWLASPVVGSAATVAMLGGGGLVLASARLRSQVAARLRVPDSYLQQAGRSLRSPAAWRAFATEQRALLRELPELERRLSRITAPTAVVIGSEDRVVPPRSAELLRRQIPGARLRMLTGVGHLLPLFQPERLAEILLAPGD